jgi:uncharacterized protein
MIQVLSRPENPLRFLCFSLATLQVTTESTIGRSKISCIHRLAYLEESCLELSGEYEIAAPRTQVWKLLNDPAVLKECIPGCEELTADGENAFAATVVLKIGPIKARFTGEVTLSDKIVPESYTITGEGKGGIAGFAKGSAKVHLAEDGGSTTLTYDVTADVGGKIAQLGSRLIASTSKKLANQFFGRFAKLAGAPAA